jgi:hypothetical protein
MKGNLENMFKTSYQQIKGNGKSKSPDGIPKSHYRSPQKLPLCNDKSFNSINSNQQNGFKSLVVPNAIKNKVEDRVRLNKSQLICDTK